MPRHDAVGRNGALAFIQKLNEDKRDWLLDLTLGDAFHWPRYLRSSRPLEVGASDAGPQDPRARGDGGSSFSWGWG